MQADEIFDIEASAGRDELGEVLIAIHRQSGVRVGLKLFDDWATEDAQAREAWRLSLEKLHAIGPARTPRIVATCIREKNSWIAMRWAEGTPLTQRLNEHGPFDENLAAEIGCGILDALSELHENGLAHGGLTPNKVILTRGFDPSGIIVSNPLQHFLYDVDNPVGADEHRFIGFPRYFSPEQAYGKPADVRSEIYVVGLILYEMVTGSTPFAAKSRAVTLRRQMSEPPMAALIENPDIDISQSFQDILNMALDKNADQRIQDPLDMRRMLAACRANPGDEASERSAAPLGLARGDGIVPIEKVIFTV